MHDGAARSDGAASTMVQPMQCHQFEVQSYLGLYPAVIDKATAETVVNKVSQHNRKRLLLCAEWPVRICSCRDMHIMNLTKRQIIASDLWIGPGDGTARKHQKNVKLVDWAMDLDYLDKYVADT